MANRLADEKSPYLLQHAQNPVDWYPWGTAALERARREDKPVLVSIGYSACHWCHVMAHESFEDESVAELMNDRFINVKVDREERPDVDAIYMEAVQALSGHGGWPLNVFLAPDGRPFFGGTYFPPTSRHGLPGWRQVLESVDAAYTQRREDVLHNADVITDAIRQGQRIGSDAGVVDRLNVDRALKSILSAADWSHGGFGGAPKFPQPLALEFLLRICSATGKSEARDLLDRTLTRMADGGIFDHLGGGFHRYTVDSTWTVPHFEKMLYDNALLARTYLNGYRVTRDARYRRVVEDTLDYLIRDMRDPCGGFYSAEDADSEGIEGKYYVWTQADLDEVLAETASQVAALRFGITAGGNFDGATVLTIAASVEDIAGALDLPPESVRHLIDEARHDMFRARSRRIPPGKDTKIVLAWNALAIRALAESGRVLDRKDYIDAAEDAVHFVLTEMKQQRGLIRTYKDGPGAVPAFLEDYAYLVEALVSLSETVPDAAYLATARDVAEEMIRRFWDEREHVFFDAQSGDDSLMVRPRSLFDNPTPSGNSSAAQGLLRLASLTGIDRYQDLAETVLRGGAAVAERAPLGLPYLLCAMEFSLGAPIQVGVVGNAGEERVAEFMRTLFDAYRPHLVVSIGEPGSAPLLENRERVAGAPTAYVCEHFSCRLPATSPGEMRRQLQSAETTRQLGPGAI